MTRRAVVLTTPRAAERWLATRGLALRYHGKSVPLPSLRAAAGPESSKAALARSIDLTNHLLGRKIAIEVSVLAGGRLVLVHRALMPAVYALARRGRKLDDLTGLSLDARQALALIRERHAVSAGDVRRALGRPADPRHDPAYAALVELQRALLVDRGPFEMPTRGIPYLPAEGYPWRLFHEAHPDLVRAASALRPDAAADAVLRAYVRESGPATLRTLGSLFKQVMSAAEISAALNRLNFL